MSRLEPQETTKTLALTMILMNVLVLTIGISVFWLVQVALSQINQINALVSVAGFS